MQKRDPKTARLGHEILPFTMGYLPEYFQKKAEIELKENPETRQKGLKILREMMESDKHFHGITFDEDFLLQYLRCRKFDAARAFSQLKAFVNLRKKNKNIFSKFNFEKIAICTRNKIVTFLPYRCQDGCAIMLVELDNWNPEIFPVEEVKRMSVIFILQSLRDPMTQVNGFKVIFDVKSNPMKHIRYVTPSNMHLMYYGTQECSPGRFKSIHIVNNSLTFKAAWLVVRPFLSAKLKSRIHFHDEKECLLEFFPAACLPVQYGGELTDYDMTDWLSDVMRPEKIATIGGGSYNTSSLNKH